MAFSPSNLADEFDESPSNIAGSFVNNSGALNTPGIPSAVICVIESEASPELATVPTSTADPSSCSTSKTFTTLISTDLP